MRSTALHPAAWNASFMSASVPTIRKLTKSPGPPSAPLARGGIFSSTLVGIRGAASPLDDAGADGLPVCCPEARRATFMGTSRCLATAKPDPRSAAIRKPSADARDRRLLFSSASPRSRTLA